MLGESIATHLSHGQQMSKASEMFKDSCHENEMTGCTIWDGELDKKLRPMVSVGKMMQVRELVFAMLTGKTLEKGQEIITKCDNPLCVNEDHFVIARTSAPQKDTFPEEELAQVEKMYFNEDKRQDKIAEILGTSQPRVSRMVTLLKKRRESAV